MLCSYVVTGGAQGVGRAIAERLAGDGHVVVLDVAEQLGDRHDRITLLTGDAADPATSDGPPRSPSRPGR